MTAATQERIGDWMQTYSGRAFYPLDPRVEEIDVSDIAHALGMICRYGGHTRRFYSVAEHCVLLSEWCEEVADRPTALWALLHDATEAYVGDMVRPLKRMMPDYAAMDDHLMRTICVRFGIPFECPPLVKEGDNRILVNERKALMGTAPLPWAAIEDLEKLPVMVTGWSPSEAMGAYTARLYDLLEGRA
jgi:hypothetical protein